MVFSSINGSPHWRSVNSCWGTMEMVILYAVLSRIAKVSAIKPHLDLNLPVCGVSAVLAAVFMKLPKPPGTFKSKFARIDWM